MKERRTERISHYELGKKGDPTRRLIDSGNFAQNLKRVICFDRDEAFRQRSKRPSSFIIEVVDVSTTIYDNAHKNGRTEYECVERIIK